MIGTLDCAINDNVKENLLIRTPHCAINDNVKEENLLIPTRGLCGWLDIINSKDNLQ